MRSVHKLRLLIGLMTGFLGLALMFTGGCRPDEEARAIDFSDTVKVIKPHTSDPDHEALRVAVAAMISPKESFVYYRELLDHLGRKLGKTVHLVQRKTYGEVNDLLNKGLIDIAFVCSGPYASESKKRGFELLAAPVIDGSHFYQSYLIVNTSSHYMDLEDLRDKVFAFTDPESNTGRLVPLYWLAAMGEQPETFFARSVFTYSHDNSILAVAKGLVDGAAIDGLIWEYFSHTKPDLTDRTRVIRKSERYGIPPVVASSSVSEDMKRRIRQTLITVHEEEQGRKILDGLRIDRFVVARDEWYDSIRKMRSSVITYAGESHGSQKP